MGKCRPFLKTSDSATSDGSTFVRTAQVEKRLDMSKTLEAAAMRSPVGGGQRFGADEWAVACQGGGQSYGESGLVVPLIVVIYNSGFN
jgi:hypothetical protein